MDSDNTLPSEAALSSMLEGGNDLASAITLSDADSDHGRIPDSPDVRSSTSDQPSTEPKDKAPTTTNLFLRQASPPEEVSRSSFSFGKIAPRLMSMSKAVVKPGLLFGQSQQPPQTMNHKDSHVSTQQSSAMAEPARELVVHSQSMQRAKSEETERMTSSPKHGTCGASSHHSDSPPPQQEVMPAGVKRPMPQTVDSPQPAAKRSRVDHDHREHPRSQTQTPPNVAHRSTPRVQEAPYNNEMHQEVSTMPGANAQSYGCAMPRVDQPAVAPARSEMNEALQIVAHTWAKAQMSAGQRTQSLVRDLRAAKAQIVQLTSNLDTANVENAEQAKENTTRAEREDHWRRKFKKLKDSVHELQNEIAALRTEADAHHHSLQAEKDKIMSLDVIIAKLESQLARGAKRSQKLSTKMMKEMRSMESQLQSSQLAAEYLLMQLEEKTGLLVEARDELNNLRARQLDTSSTTEYITEKIEAVQSALNVRIDALHDNPLVNNAIDTLRSGMAAFESEVQRRGTESSSLQITLTDLVTKCNEWSAEGVQATNSSLPEIKQLLEEKLGTVSDALQAQLEASKHESVIKAQLRDLQAELHTSKATISKLTAEHTNEAAELEEVRAEFHELTEALECIAGFDGDPDDNLAWIAEELGSLREGLEAEKGLVKKARKERDTARNDLARQLDELETLKEERLSAIGQLEDYPSPADLQRERDDHQNAIAKLKFDHAEATRKLDIESANARLGADQKHMNEMEVIRGQLHHALSQKAEIAAQVASLIGERDDLRDGLRAATNEHDLYAHSTPLLEEELAIIREQLDEATKGEAESAAGLVKAQAKYDAKIATLKTELEVLKKQALKTVKEEVTKEDLVHQVQKLQGSVDVLDKALLRAKEELTQSTKQAQRFKTDVDKMWKKEEERHTNELVTHRAAHIQLEAEMLQAENNAVQLTEKLNVAQQTIQQLHAQLEQAKSQDIHKSEHSMMRRSISRSHGCRTPDTILNELYSFLSKPTSNDRPGSGQATDMPATHNEVSSKVSPGFIGMIPSMTNNVSPKKAPQSVTKLNNQTQLPVEHESGQNVPGALNSQAFGLMSTMDTVLHSVPIFGQTPARHGADSSQFVSSKIPSTQYGSSKKKNGVSFDSMLRSSASPRAEEASQRAARKGYQKLKSMAKAGRTPLKAADGNKRSRPHLARSSKQKYDARFNEEL